MEFVVVLERDEDGVWAASVPALPGCFSQGDSTEEALRNVKEAIEAYLETAGTGPALNVRVETVKIEA